MASTSCRRAAWYRLSFFIVAFTLFCIAGASVCLAETLSFDHVLKRAVAHSWDLLIARKKIDISEYALQETKSLYYPALSVRFDNQYVRDLTDGDNVTSVGDQVVRIDGSTFQHSIGAGLTYLLYDFGARGLRTDNAKRDIRIAALNRDHSLLETRLNALEAYGRCLELVRRWNSAKETLRRRRDIYTLTSRLQKSGSAGQMEVNDTALALAEAVTGQERLRRRFEEALLNLTFFTGDTYDAVNADLAPLPSPANPKARPRPGQLAEIRVYDEEIQKLKAEKKILQKSMFPTISLAANFRMLGSDEDSFAASFENLKARDTSAALVARWEIFNGFRDITRLKRLQKEIERLSLEKDRRLHHRKRQMDAVYQSYLLAQADESSLQHRKNILKQSTKTDARLAKQQIIDQVTFLQREINFMEQRLDLTLTRMEGRIAALRLQFWQEREVR